MKRSEQRKIVEALVLAAREPLPASRIADIVPRGTPALVRELVAELNAEYEAQERAFDIWEVAGGFQFRTHATWSAYLQQLHDQRPVRLSRAALETLAVVAYRQPVTRAEIEHVRGVEAGPVVRNLLERKLIRIAGHREVPGRPMLYGTTRRFLEIFGLPSLEHLPTLRQLEELMAEAAAGASDEENASAEADGAEDADEDPQRGGAASPGVSTLEELEPSGKPH